AVHRMGQAPPPREDTDDIGEDFVQWMMCNVLRREAEALPGLAPGTEPPLRQLLPPDQAADVFAQALKLRPEDARLLLTRGNLYTRQGRWDPAAADFKKAFALQPSQHFWEWYLHATLRLWAGDTDDYRAVCKDMLERFVRPESTDLGSHQQLALIC